MAITVPSQTIETNQGDSTDFSVDVPSDVDGGVTADDWIVVVASFAESEGDGGANPQDISQPSWADATWQDEFQVGQTPPSIPGVYVFAELAAGGESGARASEDGDFVGSWDAICFVVRGVDTTTPLDVTPTTTASASVGQPNPPAITPDSDDCMVIAIGIKDQASTTAQTISSYSSGYTTIQEFSNTNTTTGQLLAVCATILSGGAASSEDPGTITGSLGDDEWAGVTIALRPAAGVADRYLGGRLLSERTLSAHVVPLG